MTQTGIARKVDDLGRIVLPVEMRRMFGIRPGDEMEISVDGGGIQLRKVEARCVFCDGDVELRPFRAKQVCAGCSSAFADAAG
ncbi:MAG: AbrB/MazE/SpoVT family DNA-binding domain-containing protein [Actinomycetota bacterium]|nr:AbrB/MazE/SpoVT family DNA-binding domain-containing protein [Actinomycetota bacterium]